MSSKGFPEKASIIGIIRIGNVNANWFDPSRINSDVYSLRFHLGFAFFIKITPLQKIHTEKRYSPKWSELQESAYLKWYIYIWI